VYQKPSEKTKTSFDWNVDDDTSNETNALFLFCLLITFIIVDFVNDMTRHFYLEEECWEE
jgi:hypothetical protein